MNARLRRLLAGLALALPLLVTAGPVTPPTPWPKTRCWPI